jgi:signal transduction histidine kinase
VAALDSSSASSASARVGGLSGARPQLVDSLRLALLGSLGVGMLAGVLEAALLVGSVDFDVLLLAFPAMTVVYLAAGVLAWWRRPGAWMGPLLMVGAMAVLVAGLGNTDVVPLALAGRLAATWILAVIVHLLLAFPSGRLGNGLLRVVVAGAYVNSVALQAPQVLWAEGVGAVAAGVQRGLGVVVMATTAVVLVGRLRAASPAQRRTLVPLYVYGMGVSVLIPTSTILLRGLLGVPPVQVAILQMVAITGIPVAFLAATLRGSFAPTAEADALASWLGADIGRPLVADALARALGDPTVTLAYWLPERAEFVDAEGHPVRVPAKGSGARQPFPVEVGGELVGVIVADTRTVHGRAVREAARVVALAIQGERLTADLRASQAQLRRSRARVVGAADRERARIARDLHDGLQVRLVLLGVEAQRLAHSAEPGPGGPDLLARATRLREGIDAVAAEVRRLAHDVMPVSLEERGLALAVEDLTDRMPIPTRFEASAVPVMLEAAVARAAYFAVSEGLANTVKHASASAASVVIAREGDELVVQVIDDGVGGAMPGSGLGGLRDRVETVGGTLTLHSPAGEGTRLRVVLPCGS